MWMGSRKPKSKFPSIGKNISWKYYILSSFIKVCTEFTKQEYCQFVFILTYSIIAYKKVILYQKMEGYYECKGKYLYHKIHQSVSSERQIPEETIRELIETAGRAPSWCSCQPWEVYVVTGDKMGSYCGGIPSSSNRTVHESFWCTDLCVSLYE